MMTLTKTTKWTSKRVAFLAMMVALSVASRTLFVALPNIQPVTVIVLLIAVQLGVIEAWSVAALTMIVTGFYLGFGYWVFAQILAYAVIVVMMRVAFAKTDWRVQAIASFGLAFVYGFIVSVGNLAAVGALNTLFPYWVAGLPFDILQASGNLVFYIVLAPLFNKLTRQYFSY